MEGPVDGNNLLLSSDLNPDATAVEKAHTHFSASVYATTFLNFVLRKKRNTICSLLDCFLLVGDEKLPCNNENGTPLKRLGPHLLHSWILPDNRLLTKCCVMQSVHLCVLSQPLSSVFWACSGANCLLLVSNSSSSRSLCDQQSLDLQKNECAASAIIIGTLLGAP